MTKECQNCIARSIPLFEISFSNCYCVKCEALIGVQRAAYFGFSVLIPDAGRICHALACATRAPGTGAGEPRRQTAWVGDATGQSAESGHTIGHRCCLTIRRARQLAAVTVLARARTALQALAQRLLARVRSGHSVKAPRQARASMARQRTQGCRSSDLGREPTVIDGHALNGEV